MSEHESTKAIFYALAANLGIAIAKGTAAIITMSGSMLAETIHSFADCSNQLLLLLGLKQSKRQPDDMHPLGYGNEVYFWSFIVAMMLFSIGGIFSIYEGMHKLHSHEPVNKVWLALIVLAVSLILESLSLMGGLKEIKNIRRNKSFSDWIKTTRNSELLVVLGEDLAAVLGLLIAFIFVALSHYLNMPALDGVGSICIGVILIIVSIFLIVRMHSLLIGKSADPEVTALIKNKIKDNNNIDDLLNVITLQIGPYIMLAGKIKMKSGLEIDQACSIINDLEKEIKQEFPEIKWSFIEPDICD